MYLLTLTDGLQGGRRDRGLNLPPPYFLSQFLPPPSLFSQFLPPPYIFSPRFLPPPFFFAPFLPPPYSVPPPSSGYLKLAMNTVHTKRYCHLLSNIVITGISIPLPETTASCLTDLFRLRRCRTKVSRMNRSQT